MITLVIGPEDEYDVIRIRQGEKLYRRNGSKFERVDAVRQQAPEDQLTLFDQPEEPVQIAGNRSG